MLPIHLKNLQSDWPKCVKTVSESTGLIFMADQLLFGSLSKAFSSNCSKVSFTEKQF
jgi:hypothetical protein